MRSRYWGLLVLGLLAVVLWTRPLPAAEAPLKFKADGTFKILLMSDLHASPDPADPETAACITLMEKFLELEKPDLVVVDISLKDGNGIGICSYVRFSALSGFTFVL